MTGPRRHWILCPGDTKVTLRELQSLIGLLNFACKVILPGRAFLRRLTNLTRGTTKPHHHIRLNKEARLDIQACKLFLQSFNGEALLLEQRWTNSDKLALYTDAATTAGYAAVFKNLWFMGHWPRSWSTFHIAILELYPIVVAVNLWGAQLANKCIIFHCDNEAVVFIINRQTSKDCILMSLVRKLVLCCMKFNILIQARHIPGLYNITADKLSRFQVKEARRATPILDRHPVQLPPSLLPDNIL